MGSYEQSSGGMGVVIIGFFLSLSLLFSLYFLFLPGNFAVTPPHPTLFAAAVPVIASSFLCRGWPCRAESLGRVVQRRIELEDIFKGLYLNQ